jgi:hypothetical protein
VSTSLSTLCANYINTKIEAFPDVLRVADHVHVKYAGFVETIDDMLRWHADGGDEQLGAAIDDDAHKLVEFALSIIVAVLIALSALAQLNCNYETDVSM